MRDKVVENVIESLKSINESLWEVIQDIHDDKIDDITEIKKRLIAISGDMYVEVIHKLE